MPPSNQDNTQYNSTDCPPQSTYQQEHRPQMERNPDKDLIEIETVPQLLDDGSLRLYSFAKQHLGFYLHYSLMDLLTQNHFLHHTDPN